MFWQAWCFYFLEMVAASLPSRGEIRRILVHNKGESHGEKKFEVYDKGSSSYGFLDRGQWAISGFVGASQFQPEGSRSIHRSV